MSAPIFEDWLRETQPAGCVGDMQRGWNAAVAALGKPNLSHPLCDSMGVPLSCGKPLCSPSQHHQLCKRFGMDDTKEVPAQEQAEPAAAAPADPMDWPLPCDVKVGHVTIKRGCDLGALVLRMKALYWMATGTDADAVAARTLEERQALFAESPLAAAPAPAQAQPLTDADRKDAARYRWLRSRPLAAEEEIYIGVDSDRVPDRWALKGDECDAIVDEFMADNPIGQPAGKGGV